MMNIVDILDQYPNLNDFINDSNKYANPHPDFLQFYILKKQIILQMQMKEH